MDKKYLIHMQNVDAQSSGLLGSFDADGSYIIEDGIIKELIACNKVITNFKDDKITATANVGSYKIDFYVYLQDGENAKKRAGLFIVEKGKLGFIQKELQTYLDSVVLDNNGAFVDEIKKRYHLYNADESEGIDLSNASLKLILGKKDGAIKKYKMLIPVLQSADKAYVAKMIVLLKDSGEHGKKVLDQFKQQVSGIKVSKLDVSYWREAKLLLDSLLMINKEVFDTFTLSKMSEVQAEYANIYKNAKEPVVVAGPSKSAPKKKEEKKKDGGDKKKKKPKAKDKGGKEKPKDKPKEKPKTTTKPETQRQEPVIHVDVIEEIEIDTEANTIKKTEVFGFRVENTVSKEKEAQLNKQQKNKEKPRDMGMER